MDFSLSSSSSNSHSSQNNNQNNTRHADHRADRNVPQIVALLQANDAHHTQRFDPTAHSMRGIQYEHAQVHYATLNDQGFSSDSESTTSLSSNTNSDKNVYPAMLHQAVQDNRSDEIQRLSQLTDINVRNDTGYTPLMVAVMQRNSRMAQVLLHHGANPDLTTTENNRSISALSIAIHLGDTRTIRTLLHANAAIHLPNTKNLLHLSIDRNNCVLVRILIDSIETAINNSPQHEKSALHALLTTRDRENPRTPIQRLSDKGHFHLADRLLKINNGRNQGGEKLLHEAFDLLEASNTTTFSPEEKDFLNALLDANLDFSIPSHKGDSLLQRAIYLGLNDIAYQLIQKQKAKQINRTNANGLAALHQCILADNIPVLQALIEKTGINLNVLGSIKGVNKQTPLHLAVKEINQEAVELLLEAGVNVKALNSKRETALHIAINKESLSIVRMLMDKKPSFHIHNDNGNTPLHLACTIDNPEQLELILSKCSEKDTIGTLTIDVQRELDLQNGLEDFGINEVYTPLQLATMYNLPDNIEVLLNFGADYTVLEQTGKNLYDLANKHKSKRALEYLMKANIDIPMRNDNENSHDTTVKEILKVYVEKLKLLLDTHKLLSITEVEAQLRHYFTHLGEPGKRPLKVLNTIMEDGDAILQHLSENSTHTAMSDSSDSSDNINLNIKPPETEKSILCLVYTFITLQPEEKRSEFMASLVNRFQDCFQLSTGTAKCSTGRANRLLDTFTLLLPGFVLFSTDLLRQELLQKASYINTKFYHEQSQETQEALRERIPSEAQKQFITDYDNERKRLIRKAIYDDYLPLGVLSQSRIDSIINEWIDAI